MRGKRLLDFDVQLSGRMRVAGRPGPLRRLAILLAHSGDSWFWLAGLLIFWLIGSPHQKTWALALGGGIVATAVLVMAIKFLVRRQRPQGEWGEIYRRTDPHSFPSGHAARGAMLAVMAMGSGPLWFSVLLVIWAPLVALARVAMGVHYLSDILGGALLGAFLGMGYLWLLAP